MKEKWEIKKLGEVFETSSGGTPSSKKTEYYENGTISWLRSGEVNQRFINQAELKITELGLSNSSAKIFPKGTVLIAMYGATVGQVGVLNFSSATNQAICGILPNEKVENSFLYYFLKSKKEAFIKQAIGGAQPNISQQKIKDTLIPIPPLSTQEKIVSELDTLHRLKELQEQQLAELDNLAQSTFYNLFGDPIENEKGWEVRNLIDIVHLQRGHDLPIANRKNGIIPVYGSNGIVGYHNEMKKENGIITGRSGTIGKVIYSKSPFWPLNTTLYSINTHGNNIIYLTFLLNEFKLDRFYNGTGVPTLNRNVIHKEKVINPPLSLQTAFAERIDKIEAQKELIKQSIGETEQLIGYTMDKYFG